MTVVTEFPIETRWLPDPLRTRGMSTAELRGAFLLEKLFVPDALRLVQCDLDRAVVGAAMPAKHSLPLEKCSQLGSEYFTERRELGVINIGGPGTVVVDETLYRLETRHGLYIGRGTRKIVFDKVTPENGGGLTSAPSAAGLAPDFPCFYFVSYPAHQAYPTRHISLSDAEATELGTVEEANRRVIRKYIRPPAVNSCQLVMGLTELAAGSVWNTMPPHVHPRRSEIYMYFDFPDGDLVLHNFGQPDETRHLIVRSRQAVLSPGWSIHAGVGTRSYAFIWAMGGENQEFGDMCAVAKEDLR